MMTVRKFVYKLNDLLLNTPASPNNFPAMIDFRAKIFIHFLYVRQFKLMFLAFCDVVGHVDLNPLWAH